MLVNFWVYDIIAICGGDLLDKENQKELSFNLIHRFKLVRFSSIVWFYAGCRRDLKIVCVCSCHHHHSTKNLFGK